MLRRWIGLELRRLRLAAGKSRPEVAARLTQSRTTIGHLETARNLPSGPALEVLLGYYGVPERLPFFLDLVAAARKGHNWWDRLAEAMLPWFDRAMTQLCVQAASQEQSRALLQRALKEATK